MRAIHHWLVAPGIGGAAQTALQLMRGLRRCGIENVAWLPAPGPAATAVETQGIAWREFPLRALQGGLANRALASLRITPRLLASRPLLAHVHNDFLYGLIAPLLHLVRVRSVVHFQIEPTGDDVRWALRVRPDAIVACAHHVARRIEHFLPETSSPQRIHVVPNAVDTARFSPTPRDAAKRRLNAPPDKPLLLIVANLAPHKGQETTLRTVAKLKKRGLALECWIVGEERGGGTRYTEQLRALACDLDVHDRVRMLGFREDVAELLQAADFLLLPSTHEGLPLTILEAQATKVPVLAAPTAGIPEVVEHDRTGFLIPADDPDGYADCIARLLANAGVARAITEEAYRRVVPSYDWSTYVGRMRQIYHEVLTPPPFTVDEAA